MTTPLPKKSIAVLRYPEGDSSRGYATGFFVDTRRFGRVCVTAAHVFDRDRHQGSDRTKLLVNGKMATLVYNAFEAMGVDVALLSIPNDIDPEDVVFHTPGVSHGDGSAFYSHAWSSPKADPSSLTFTKIWGVRFGPDEIQDRSADPLTARAHQRWRLRSDVAKRPTQFEPAIFQPGWSGAPVFNVRPNAAQQRVIGVLSKHAGDLEAVAPSITSLEFLEPREEQTDEIMPPPLSARPSGVKGRQGRDTVVSAAHVAAMRFVEISGKQIVPKISEPPSPYDDRPPRS